MVLSMKYKTFNFTSSMTPVFAQGKYTVYEVPDLGRWYLVKDNKELAWKNYKVNSPDYAHWIRGWEKVAEHQLLSLQSRVDELLDERDEILNLLPGAK